MTTKPKFNKGATHSRKVRTRAHQIYQESGGRAKAPDIQRQLLHEGFPQVSRATLGIWKDRDSWARKSVDIPDVGPLGEALRQAAHIRIPDDLYGVELASNRLASVVTAIADRVLAQMPQVTIESAADVETMARAAGELLKMHLVVNKGLQDLRLLRVTTNFGEDEKGKPLDGQVLPPEGRADEPMSEQERVLSNFE